MSQKQINHNPDIQKLQNEGYTVEIRDGYIIVHDIPYINNQKECCKGSLICPLCLSGEKVIPPSDHVVHFSGEQPCDANGCEITGIKHPNSPRIQDIGNGIVIQRSFSNKPKGKKFTNYYDKFMNYIRIIYAPVHVIDAEATPKLYKPITEDEDSVFCYCDTNSSRANIGGISKRLSRLKIGIVGLGGTGSYILDLVSKTYVSEIHLFDADKFNSHNAFRAPGAAPIGQLNSSPYKTDYFSSIYSNMHKGIICHKLLLGEKSLDCLLDMNFVFLSMDSSLDKKYILDALVKAHIPFIDTGIGVNIQNELIDGIIRNTAVFTDTSESWMKRISFDDSDDDGYSSNIQIAELNSLCAIMAVMKWKKMYKVYADLDRNDFTNFGIGVGDLVNANQ